MPRSFPATVSIISWLEKRGKFVQPELTHAQKQSLRETFNMIDTDSSGHIEQHELSEAFHALGLNVPEQKVKDILGKADLDGNSTVDFSEFLHLMTSVMPRMDVGNNAGKAPKKAASSDPNVPLQLLATAYRRRKTLMGVMHDNAFRRRLTRQNEQELER